MSKQSNVHTIMNTTFVYSSVVTPKKQLNPENKPHLTDHDLEGYAWEVCVLMSESEFKKFKKEFKGAPNVVHAKDFEPAEAAEKFFIDEPEDDVVKVKFSQKCLTGKKNDRKEAKPITQIGIKGKVLDRNEVPINQETEMGNGTKGHLQFRSITNDFGTFLYPMAVCITELVERQSSEGGSFDADAFGIEEVEERFEEVVRDEDEDFQDPNF